MTTSSPPPMDRSVVLQTLSALHDGQADEAQSRQACDGWRHDPEVRSQWHAWQLIGDVMRSEDLASEACHDVAFLHRLRTRLQAEPVVLAPGRLVADEAAWQEEAARLEAPQVRPALVGVRPRRWAAPAAVAAGFMAVAGALVVLQTSGPEAGQGTGSLAMRAPAGATSTATAVATAPGGEVMVRNADLDRYLAAHRQFAQGPALAAPGGLRQVVVVRPDAR